MENFNSLDLETFGTDKITPYCLCVIYREKRVVFYGLDCVQQSLKWLFNTCLTNTILYVHNLSFDGNIILNFLPSKYEIDFTGTLLIRGDFYSLTITNGLKRITFRCSAKILPLPLDDIGQIFNIGGKKFVDHSFANINNINDLVFKRSIIKYCEQDTKIVSRFLDKINYSVGKLYSLSSSYSISGLALGIFTKNFNNFFIKIKTSIEFDTLLRPAYYGGRCEVFGNLKKDEQCFHFDFSGMYTSRLAELYPYGDFKINNDVKKITDNGFYFVSVYSNLDLPILPYRDEMSGKLLFPNGSFFGLYWCEEILLFMEAGGVVEQIHYGVEFTQKNLIFYNFSKICEEMRQKTQYDKILWKLIPNSFIGRLGLKNDNEITLLIKDSEYDPRSLDVICDKKINNNWIVRVKDKVEKKNHPGNVMYPAIITAKARILWWKSSKAVIAGGGRILYCDTDSIFAAFDNKNSPLNKHHGDVYWDPNKIDTKLDDACFATSKVYCISYKNTNIVKIKGVSKKYITDLDMSKFKDNFFNNKIDNFKTIIFEKTKLDIKIIELNKIIDFSSYDKRIFNEDKTETQSIEIKKKYPI